MLVTMSFLFLLLICGVLGTGGVRGAAASADEWGWGRVVSSIATAVAHAGVGKRVVGYTGWGS